MSKESSQPLLVNVAPGAGLPPYQPYPGTYQAIPVTVSIEVRPHERGYRRSPLRRFLTAIFVAIGVWAVLKTLFHHSGHKMKWDGADNWNIQSNMRIDGCVDATSNSSHATFEIPLNADTGASLSGSLDIATSPRLKDKAKITVHFVRGTDTKACLVTGSDGEAGVGLFTKGSWTGHRREGDFVTINAVLPRATTPLQLKGIVAELPDFSLNIGNLKNSVDFKSAIFRTSNSPVNVKSLTADHVRLHSSNGHIFADSLISPELIVQTSNSGVSGTYNTSGTLQITTSNAPIRVTVNLESNNDSHNNKSRSTAVHLRTSNHRLDAKVNLLTNANSGGDFVVSGTTSNGRLAIAVPGSPAGSKLSLAARTSNEPAEVHLHNAYQGSFGISTSNFKPEVKRVNETGDQRQIEYEGSGGGRRGGNGAVKGYVYEKEKNREWGNVVVRTSNAPAVLWI